MRCILSIRRAGEIGTGFMLNQCQMEPMKQDEFDTSRQKAAKLTWTKTGWIVRYPGSLGEVLRMQLAAEEYADAFEEANRRLTHEPETEWIIC